MSLHRPPAVLLDMDGTLTAPVLDFDAIRADIGIPSGQGILEAMSRMSSEEYAIANAKLLRYEHHAASTAEVAPGSHELLARLAAANIPTALITRNTLTSTHTILARYNLKLGALVTREDPPYKPHSAPLYLALNRLQVTPKDMREVWMIGDGDHDIHAAHAAGTTSIWISHGRQPFINPAPHHTVESLCDVLNLLKMLGI